MDTKFRKLISRLSVKEKKLEKVPYPRMISACPLVLPVDSTELANVNEHLTKSGSPSTNILTDLKFPCPTLLRKSKSMVVYEEVKPRTNSTGTAGSDSDDSSSQRSSGTRADGKDTMNLHEVEQERRRLVAAQRVRAKYAESWIDGQVVDDSILGDNKERTKIYWESLMRQESLEREKEKLNQLNNKNRTPRLSSTTSPIIQKINAEIQELQRREKELMSRSSSKGSTTHLTSVTSQQEEDDEVFSSNSSSLDEFEPSESPRLESGFYSNLGEDENPLLVTATEEIKVTAVVDLVSEPTAEVRPAVPDVTEEVKVEEKVEKEIRKKFEFRKETPIEREIRQGTERDEEHRRRLSSVTESTTPKIPVVAEPKKIQTNISVKTTKQSLQDNRLTSGAGSVVRTIQYQMATERLRKEMQEVQRREDEFQKLHRTVSMTTLGTVETVEPPQREEVQVPVVEVSQIEVQVVQSPVTVVPVPEVKVNGHDHEVSSVSTKTPPFSKSGINSFNSIQRYLLKSSVQLRISKNFQLPPSPKESTEDKTVTVESPKEVQAPRRKLVPATHKIQNELREMQEREQELALIRTRSFKSTPNLFVESSSVEDCNGTDGYSNDNRDSFGPKDRKRSGLINQWETIIQNGS